MLPHKGNWFGGEIVQTLLDNVTTEEYRGKIIIILGGYKEHVEELFSLNPGFQSRFDKMRVDFPEWDGTQAAKAVVNAIVKDGKTMSEEALAALPGFFNTMRELPNWASARDAMEIILKGLEVERAARSYAIAKERRELEAAKGEGAGAGGKAGAGGGARSAAARKQAPPPIPFELSDLIRTFETAIKSRGGSFDSASAAANASSSTGGAVKAVRLIHNQVGLKSTIQRSSSSFSKLLVVCFTAPSWCGHCVAFAPRYEAVAEALVQAAATSGVLVEFTKVEDEELMEKEGIRGFPTTRLYWKGQPVGSDVRGNDEFGLRGAIDRQMAVIAKQASHAPPPLPPAGGGGGGGAMAPPKAKYNVKAHTNTGEEGSDSEDDDDFLAALEEAIGRLGMSMDDVKKMLEDEASFPPAAVMDIIKQITGCSDASKIIKALAPQRLPVLEKVKKSITERDRVKSEEEAKVQRALQAIGKCCMGFEWLPVGDGGYRCAGGSHFCSASEIAGEMNKL